MPDSALAPTSLIMVALMNDPRDLEIARLLGWYRIPLRSAPKVIAVDYLAFYQTAAFGAEKWRIQYIAPVRGHELVRRIELLRDEPDHPHAQEEYYKLQIGALERLDKPLPADQWRRITFFYTTGEHLMNSQSVRDLIVQSNERQSLWQALRERANRTQAYQTELPETPLDPALLAALLGISELEEAAGLKEKKLTI